MYCPFTKVDMKCSECRAYDKYLRRCLLMHLLSIVTDKLEGRL